MEPNQPNNGLPPGVTEVVPVQSAAPAPAATEPQPNLETQPQDTDSYEGGGEVVKDGTGNFFKETNWLFMVIGTVFIWGAFAWIDFTRRRAFLHSDKTQEQDAKITTLQNDVSSVRQQIGS